MFSQYTADDYTDKTKPKLTLGNGSIHFLLRNPFKNKRKYPNWCRYYYLDENGYIRLKIPGYDVLNLWASKSDATVETSGKIHERYLEDANSSIERTNKIPGSAGNANRVQKNNNFKGDYNNERDTATTR